MNTPAHLFFAAGALARPGERRVNAAALAGAFIPDASLYLMVPWERFVNGRTPRQIFREDYYGTWWQTVFAVDNSAFLWAAALVVSLATRTAWAAALSVAALLHIALDFPLHAGDGRAHFQPLTGWVFHSPVSYWDGRMGGDAIGLAEVAACAVLAVVLWRRFESRWARAAIVVGLAAETAAGGVWSLVF